MSQLLTGKNAIIYGKLGGRPRKRPPERRVLVPVTVEDRRELDAIANAAATGGRKRSRRPPVDLDPQARELLIADDIMRPHVLKLERVVERCRRDVDRLHRTARGIRR